MTLRQMRAFILASLLFTCSDAVFSQQLVTIGVRAYSGEDVAIQQWQPTADYLTQQHNNYVFRVVPVVGLEELTLRVGNGEFDFVITNPSSYVELSVKHGATRILTLINDRQGVGVSEFGSVIFSRQDRDDIRDIVSLRGKKLLAVSEPAFGGWRVAWLEMKKHDLDPYEDLASLQFTEGNQQDVVFGVRDGLADVGVVRSDMLERMAADGLVDISQFKVLNQKKFKSFPFLLSTPLYPEWPFVKVANTSDDLARDVAISLLQMPVAHPAARQGKYQGWTVPADYSSVQVLLQELKVGPYVGFGEISFRQALMKNLPWIIGLSVVTLLALFGALYVLRVNHNLTRARLQLENNRDELEKRVEQRTSELSSSETRLRSVINTMVDGLVTIDEMGIIESFNPAAESLFGYSLEEVKGRNVKMLMPEYYASLHDGYLKNFRDTGVAKIIGIGREVEGLRKDGSIFPLDLAVSEMWLGKKRVFNGIVRDITERKKIDKLKNEFVSTVSHELRTPLTSIRGALGLVLGGVGGELNQKMKAMLEIASNNTERLLLLINDILDINKIESGQMSFKFQLVNIDQLLRETLRDHESYARANKVKFRLQDSVQNTYVYIDPDRISQVLANLMSNAAKFSRDGTVVEVSAKKVDSAIRISVKDHGPGIDDGFKSRIFERFTQSDSTDTRKAGGTGLGLAISKAIVEKHNGIIGYETVIGEGSTFYFELPYKETAESEKHERSTSEGNNILVIEDEADVATLICAMLKKADFNCVVATNIIEARELLARDHFLAATLDIHMPDENGISFLQGLRRDPAYKDFPFIIVSVEANEARSKLSGSSIHVSDWIGKPIDEQRLLQAVMRAAKKGCPKILHVEDELDVAKIVSVLLENSAEIHDVTTLAAAKQALIDTKYDLVLLDLCLPDGSGLELLDVISKMSDAPEVVIFSANEVADTYMEHVSAALLKSRTSNFQLVSTLKRVLGIR